MTGPQDKPWVPSICFRCYRRYWWRNRSLPYEHLCGTTYVGECDRCFDWELDYRYRLSNYDKGYAEGYEERYDAETGS